MTKDQIDELREKAAALARETMQRDSRKPEATAQLRRVIAYVDEHLFEDWLGAKKVWAEAGSNNHALSAKFQILTGVELAPYIRHRRAETATWLLRHTRLKCWEVGETAVLGEYSTFNSAVQEINEGLSPLKVREQWWEAYGEPEEQDPEQQASLELWQRVAKRLPVAAEDLRALFEHFSSFSAHVQKLKIPQDTEDAWWADSMVVVEAVK